MNTASIITLSLLGFTWGYHPLDLETTEYIVQLRQHELQVLVDGTHEIISIVPPEARPVGRIRILVGTEELPRQALPPKQLPMKVNPTQSATAFGQGAGNSHETIWKTDAGGQSSSMAGNRAAPTDGPSQPNRSWTSVYGTRTNNWGGLDPLVQPGPVDGTTMSSRWSLPLAWPVPLPSNGTPPIDPIQAPSLPTMTGPALGNPRDGLVMKSLRDANPQDNLAGGNVKIPGVTAAPDRRGTVGVPQPSERGQDVGIRHSKQGGNGLEARGQDSRIDWGAIANLPKPPASKPNTTESENDRSVASSVTPAAAGPSPSNKQNLDSPEDDNSTWRSWTLLLGPVAIALAGLNVYQWGIYKSVRRRYLTLLRRTGEV